MRSPQHRATLDVHVFSQFREFYEEACRDVAAARLPDGTREEVAYLASLVNKAAESAERKGHLTRCELETSVVVNAMAKAVPEGLLRAAARLAYFAVQLDRKDPGGALS